MLLLSALALGFMGSLHCVGMCGPISLALTGTKKKSKFWQGRILYNLGRTITYVFLGMLIGTFGHSLILVGTQQSLSVVLGLLWLFLLLFLPNWENALLKMPIAKKLLLRIKTRLSLLLKSDRLPLMFNAGIINGFLPCGLVYLALTGAMASMDIGNAMLFMFVFGLGTFPAMLALSYLASIRTRVLPYIKPVLYSLSHIFALLLIVRGLDLGIPYLSPELTSSDATNLTCE